AEVSATLERQCAPVLYQLPSNRQADVPLLREFLLHLPKDIPAAFEFRHPSWFDDATYAALREHRAALCIAESEELSTPPVATAPYGYFRLRRLDYDAAALRKSAETLQEPGFAEHVFVSFKPGEEAVGPKFAREFLPLLNS